MKTNKPKKAPRDKIVAFLDEVLKIKNIPDASRNGLQVEGTDSISRVGLAVDACQEAYEAAAARKCQMVIAHHGMIWNGITSVTGTIGRQIKFLLDNGINLYAAHLPLDLHPRLGNNARLAAGLGLRSVRPFGDYHGTLIGFEGSLKKGATLEQLSRALETLLGSVNTTLPFGKTKVQRIAIVSGSASEIIEEAIAKKIDCYVTGEPKHAHHHAAKESGLNVIYCGHYHSETPGVRALGKLIEKKFGVQSLFLDVPTIV